MQPVSPDQRSKVLPTDPFDIALSNLTGHPNGAHTQPSVVQSQDHYGNVTSFMVQTVKWEDGITVFVTQVNAERSARFVLPPKVTAVIARQADAVSLMVRRRHGKRLAEERKASGIVPSFTPEMREKALASRKAKALRVMQQKLARAKRRAR